MNKPSKSKAEVTACPFCGHSIKRDAPSVRCDNCRELITFYINPDIIARMEAMQESFGAYPPGSYGEYLEHTGRSDNRENWYAFLAKSLRASTPFPSILQSAENERRLQLNDRADWVQDGDPPALHGESEADYNERTGRYE